MIVTTSTTDRAVDVSAHRMAAARRVITERAGDARQQFGEQMGPKLADAAGLGARAVADGVSPLGAALRLGAEQLRGQGLARRARALAAAADGIDGLARQLRERPPEELGAQVRQGARSRPWLVGAGGALVGLAAGTFAKAATPPSAATTPAPQPQTLP